MRSLFCAALLALAAPAASSVEPQALEPALQVQWAFGGTASPAPRWRLGLYPNDVVWRRTWADAGLAEAAASLPRPALVAFDAGGGARAGLSVVGLPMNAVEEQSSTRWPLYVGGAVLALGAVWAWAVDETGEALAEGLTPRPDDAGEDEDDVDGGLLCINGQCLLPCGTTGPINSCSDG